eukprot:TRINITY_DN30430_c0_g2_i1.p1 TRINITY_DN30430_c0_g2~~TRINITY_DN30430_c0_g2_i1.p1  ORF type:complete len:1380 (-),score=278.00 TRINITY_DN30430_c0_g2_i1:589-4728(-)
MAVRPLAESDALGHLQAALEPLDLASVPDSAWQCLEQRREELQDQDQEHPGRAAACEALAEVLRDSAQAWPTDEPWQWLAQPACPGALPRIRALVVVLGESVTRGESSSGLCWSAGSAYLALLAARGAERCWGSLFHPAIFRFTLSRLRRCLAVRSMPRTTSVVPSAPDLKTEPGASESSTCPMTQERAVQLLDSLIALLKVRSFFSSSREMTRLLVSELAQLLARPVSSAVGEAAASGLSLIVAGASDLEELRTAAAMVLRASLPALLMSQNSLGSMGVGPKHWELHGRRAALGLAEGLIQGRPLLLLPRYFKEEECDEKDAETTSERPVDDPLLALLQHLCVSAAERAERRQLTTEAILDLLAWAVAAERAVLAEGSASEDESVRAELAEEVLSRGQGVASRFLCFLERFLRSERSSFRVVAVELASLMLERGSLLAPALVERGRVQIDQRLLQAVLTRCYDSVATVRSHALSGLGVALKMLATYVDGQKLLSGALRGAGEDEDLHMDLPRLFKVAALDDKVQLRRAAMTLFDSAARAIHAVDPGRDLSEFFDCSVLGMLAADNSLVIRRSAINSLSVVLKLCPTPSICMLWAKSVLPLALDGEGTVVERALEAIDAAIFTPLTNALSRSQGWRASASENKDEHVLVDRDPVPQIPSVLQHLPQEGTEYLQRAVRCFSCRQQGLKLVNLTTSLASVVADFLERPILQWPQVVWPLLEELASLGTTGAVLPELVLNAWEAFDAAEQKVKSLGAKILSVLQHCAARLPALRAQSLASKLCERLAALKLPAEQAAPAMRILEGLRAEGLAPNVDAWRQSLLKSIEALFLKYSHNGQAPKFDNPDSLDAEHLEACVFLLGELALAGLDLSSTSAGVVSCLQGMAAGDTARPRLRSHAVAALGKLCLHHEALAKRSVEIFVFLLGPAEPLAVRSTALIVLSDLCVQYTALVDRFVLHLADLLRDDCELLRRQAAMVLASLLSENFIKFRGNPMYRFLYALSDPSLDVRSIVESTFERILLPRQPGLFSWIFVGTMCVLNGWSGHPNYPGAETNKQFSLEKCPKRRAQIYRFMLSLMTREQKFNVCCQLVTGFLAHFTASEEWQRLELPSSDATPGGQALSDAFVLLGCKEMRVCFSPRAAAVQEDEDAEADALEAARGVFSGVLKRVVTEKIVPIMVQLKAVMEEHHSSFLGRLRICLCEILREFGDDEIRELFGCDEHLAEEVFFDLAQQRPAPSCPISQILGSGPIRRRQSVSSAMASVAAAVEDAMAEPLLDATSGATPAGPELPKEKVQAENSSRQPGPARKRRIPGKISQTQERHPKKHRISSCESQVLPGSPDRRLRVDRHVATPQLAAERMQSTPGVGLMSAAMGLRSPEVKIER